MILPGIPIVFLLNKNMPAAIGLYSYEVITCESAALASTLSGNLLNCTEITPHNNRWSKAAAGRHECFPGQGPAGTSL